MLLPRSTVKAILLSSLSIPSLVAAHTWVEQLMVIAPNGTMVGQPGFPRNNVLRTTAGFNDASMVFLIPPNGGPVNKIDADQLMCRPGQTTQVQSAGSPRLEAAPGQAVALRYQENGHVTLPQNQPGKPSGSGANFVYLTTNSKPDDKFLEIHRQWTADGKGGDGRGKLISTQNFDDGQCYQINGQTISKQRQAEFPHETDTLQGQALWCQQDIQIPVDAQPGTTVTLYWVWDWPTLPGTPGFPQGKQEIYTTCMDIDIVAANGQSKAVAKGFVKQDFANAAVAAQFSDVGNPTAIKAQIIPFSGINAASVSASAGQFSSSVANNNSAISTTSTLSPAPSSANMLPTQATMTVTATGDHGHNHTHTHKVRPTATVTAIQTDFVTVMVTRTVANKRESESSSVPLSMGLPLCTSLASHKLTSEVVSSAESTGCSTTERAYQLRARNPFYILPSSDQLESTAGAGC